jgi:hypothetical protein
VLIYKLSSPNYILSFSSKSKSRPSNNPCWYFATFPKSVVPEVVHVSAKSEPFLREHPCFQLHCFSFHGLMHITQLQESIKKPHWPKNNWPSTLKNTRILSPGWAYSQPIPMQLLSVVNNAAFLKTLDRKVRNYLMRWRREILLKSASLPRQKTVLLTRNLCSDRLNERGCKLCRMSVGF